MSVQSRRLLLRGWKCKKQGIDGSGWRIVGELERRKRQGSGKCPAEFILSLSPLEDKV